MSILDRITKIKPQAPRITLYGKPGVGKSTLASQFPSPLFILTEENNILGHDATPIMKTFEELWATIDELLKVEDLPYKTIIVDSISKLDQLVIRRVIETSPPNKKGVKPKTIAQAYDGYGAGFLRAAGIHRTFKAKMDEFTNRGITVLYISHIEVKKCKLPDQEDFEIFSIIMNGDASRSVYIDDVDLVGFCKLKSHTVETESGRSLIKSSGKRILSVGVNDVHVSKNRYAMPDEIDMSFEALSKYIPFYQPTEKKK